MKPTLATAVGKRLQYGDIKGSVIGVVQDFNFKPIQQPIEPLVLQLGDRGSDVVVRAKPGQTAAAVHVLAEISRELNPGYPFSLVPFRPGPGQSVGGRRR